MSPSNGKDEQLAQLRALLPSNEVFERGSKEYATQSAPWSTWADRHPTLVLQPTNLERMSAIVRALYHSDLDFAVRNTGTGSVSAEDVILSTHGFKAFDFSAADETMTIGSGFDWGEVEALMEERAPGYQVVGARCSWVGVTGSTLVGGLSWLSHEFGMICDEQNLLDMQIVLADGRVVWAAGEQGKEEGLMWALRGGGGNFGVVTALKFRAHRYPTQVFCALMFYPYSSLPDVSRAVHAMHVRKADPRVAMHVFDQGAAMGLPPGGKHPNIAIMAYDAHGAEHAHASSTEGGLSWLWELPGAQEVQAQMMTLREVSAIAERFRSYQGLNMFWLCAPLLQHVDEHTLERAWDWWGQAYDTYPGFEQGSTVLLEFMQEAAYASTTSRAVTAWPHNSRRHVMQLVLGCKAPSADSGITADEIRAKVMKLFQAAGPTIAGGADKDTGEFHAGFLHEWNDLRQVYGENFDRLREVKARYDPKNRFNKSVDLASERPGLGTTV